MEATCKALEAEAREAYNRDTATAKEAYVKARDTAA